MARSPRITQATTKIETALDNKQGIARRDLVPPDEPRAGFVAQIYALISEILISLGILNQGAKVIPDTVYVDGQGGSDSNTGSVDQPVATIQKAHDLLLERVPHDPGVILVGPGTYTDTLVLLHPDITIAGTSRFTTFLLNDITVSGTGSSGVARLVFRQLAFNPVGWLVDAPSYTGLLASGLYMEDVLFGNSSVPVMALSAGAMVTSARAEFRQCYMQMQPGTVLQFDQQFAGVYSYDTYWENDDTGALLLAGVSAATRSIDFVGGRVSVPVVSTAPAGPPCRIRFYGTTVAESPVLAKAADLLVVEGGTLLKAVTNPAAGIEAYSDVIAFNGLGAPTPPGPNIYSKVGGTYMDPVGPPGGILWRQVVAPSGNTWVPMPAP